VLQFVKSKSNPTNIAPFTTGLLCFSPHPLQNVPVELQIRSQKLTELGTGALSHFFSALVHPSRLPACLSGCLPASYAARRLAFLPASLRT
jgi:hypothetical protein